MLFLEDPDQLDLETERNSQSVWWYAATRAGARLQTALSQPLDLAFMPGVFKFALMARAATAVRGSFLCHTEKEKGQGGQNKQHFR